MRTASRSGARPRVFAGLAIIVGETGDDELAFAYYSANLATLRDGPAYDRRVCGRTYRRIAASMYELAHVRTVVHMIANAVGVHPGRWLIRSGARAGWWWHPTLGGPHNY